MRTGEAVVVNQRCCLCVVVGIVFLGCDLNAVVKGEKVDERTDEEVEVVDGRVEQYGWVVVMINWVGRVCVSNSRPTTPGTKVGRVGGGGGGGSG